MKVLHVLPSISRRLGGPTTLVFSLIRELRSQGIEAQIVSTNDDGDGVLDIPPGVCTEYEGVPCTVFKRSFLRRREYIVSPSLALWLARNVKKFDLLDLHYLFTFSTSIAAGAALIRKVPYTVRTMGEFAPWALRQNGAIKSLHRSLFENWILSRANIVQCTTKGEREDVISAGVNAPISIVPLGVKIPNAISGIREKVRVELGINGDSFLLLFLSRLHRKKRPEFAIDLLATLPKNAALLVAGAGDASYERSLLLRCENLGLLDRVKFLGQVSASRGEELRQASDLFVLPSESDNFALSVAEALASRLPVAITPEVQIAPYLIEAKAGLVIPSDIGKWSEKLTFLIRDQSSLAELSNNARALAEREFSISIAAKRLTELYLEIIKNSGQKLVV